MLILGQNFYFLAPTSLKFHNRTDINNNQNIISEYIDAIGTTERTDEEIKVFNEAFLENNPTYHVLTSNCQDYANVFTKFLMAKGDRKGWLPKVESPRKTSTKMSDNKL